MHLFICSFTTAQWKDVCVGDILRIHRDQVIPVCIHIYIYISVYISAQKKEIIVRSNCSCLFVLHRQTCSSYVALNPTAYAISRQLI